MHKINFYTSCSCKVLGVKNTENLNMNIWDTLSSPLTFRLSLAVVDMYVHGLSEVCWEVGNIVALKPVDTLDAVVLPTCDIKEILEH